MRKLSKKEKLIGFRVILIIVIILSICITKNIISKNTKVTSQEEYLATTANANSNLLASYIREGITIGGITGTLEILDTSDANATPEDIIWGETAYVKGVKITGTKIVTVAHAKEAQKIFEKNTVLLDEYGNRVKVPTGFKIAEDSAINVTDGVVIEDVNAGDNNTKGSQFVWVPVGDVATDSNGNKTTIKLGRYNFDQITAEPSAYSGNYTEKMSGENVYNNATAKNINDFLNKTQNTHGYYIGRYEAGDAYATEIPRTGENNVSSSSNPLTCKKGIYPYNYINQIEAAKLAANMYNNTNFESDLINSYAWDTAINFIQTFSEDKFYALCIAYQNTLAKCGEATNGVNNDVKCNIYDMGGNMSEWSTETGVESIIPCVDRGGCYANKTYNTSFRGGTYTYMTNETLSFRPILYL